MDRGRSCGYLGRYEPRMSGERVGVEFDMMRDQVGGDGGLRNKIKMIKSGGVIAVPVLGKALFEVNDTVGSFVDVARFAAGGRTLPGVKGELYQEGLKRFFSKG